MFYSHFVLHTNFPIFGVVRAVYIGCFQFSLQCGYFYFELLALIFPLLAWVYLQVKDLSWCEAALASQLGVRSCIHFPEPHTTGMFCSWEGYHRLWRNGKATTDIKEEKGERISCKCRAVEWQSILGTGCFNVLLM